MLSYLTIKFLQLLLKRAIQSLDRLIKHMLVWFNGEAFFLICGINRRTELSFWTYLKSRECHAESICKMCTFWAKMRFFHKSGNDVLFARFRACFQTKILDSKIDVMSWWNGFPKVRYFCTLKIWFFLKLALWRGDVLNRAPHGF